jgi:hypothetical protein
MAELPEERLEHERPSWIERCRFESELAHHSQDLGLRPLAIPEALCRS